MKIIFSFSAFVFGIFFCAHGQRVGIGTTAPSNVLHVFSTADPLRIEGLTSGAATDSVLTANALGVVRRRTLASTISSAGWALAGNTATNPASQFIGTTDLVSLVFRTNNLRSGFIDFDSTKRNNSFGNRAMAATITGNGNNAFGYQAMRNLTSGTNNTAIGDSAAFSLNTGADNVAIGSDAGRSIQNGIQNVAIGSRTLSGEAAGSNNVGIGFRAMEISLGSENVAIGATALAANIAGTNNIAVGSNSLASNTSGYNNLAIGNDALSALVTGYENLGIGYHVGITSTTQIQNTLIGHYAFSSLMPANSASYNTLIGFQAGGKMTGGNNNVALGFLAMGNILTSNSNTFVGYAADASAINVSNCGAFGNGATVAATNQYRFGNSSVTSIGGQVGWTTLSDERVKTNVLENVQGLEFIAKLRPVTYNYSLDKIDNWQKAKPTTNAYNTANTTTRFSGFLAQEVLKTSKETGYEFSGVDIPENDKALYGIRYAEFVVPLVKAVQELKAIVEQQQEQIKQLEIKLKNK